MVFGMSGDGNADLRAAIMGVRRRGTPFLEPGYFGKARKGGQDDKYEPFS